MISDLCSKLAALRLSVLLLLIIQSSCTTLPETTSITPANWQDTVSHRMQITSWKVQGRLGVQTEDNGGSLDLYWKQEGESYTIRLIAPFGQGTILIKGDSNGVYIKTKDAEEYAANADALLASTLGIDIPVTGLRDWLRGLPMGNKPASGQRWDDQGHLYSLTQANWNIEMNQYQQVGHYILPHSFYLGRDDRPELGIRLLIRQWQAGPA